MIDEEVLDSSSDEFGTPQDLFEAWDSRYHFTLDAAASHTNHKCARYFTKEDNALLQEWVCLCKCHGTDRLRKPKSVHDAETLNPQLSNTSRENQDASMDLTPGAETVSESVAELGSNNDETILNSEKNFSKKNVAIHVLKKDVSGNDDLPKSTTSNDNLEQVEYLGYGVKSYGNDAKNASVTDASIAESKPDSFKTTSSQCLHQTVREQSRGTSFHPAPDVTDQKEPDHHLNGSKTEAYLKESCQTCRDKNCLGPAPRVFVNPPYSRGNVDAFVRKAYEESLKGGTTVMLLPCRTEQPWFHDLVIPFAKVQFIRKRVHFIGGTTSARFPSIMVVFEGKECLAPTS